MENINTNWWIAVNEENEYIVNRWYQKYWPRTRLQKGNLAGVYKNRNGKFQVGMLDSMGCDKVGYSYDFGNEISFNDFEKYILKEDVFPENWCLKVTEENHSYINRLRTHGLINTGGFIHSKLNGGEARYWLWNEEIVFSYVEITLDNFKKHVILEEPVKEVSIHNLLFKKDTLPEKWCIKLNEHNISALNTFLVKNKEHYPSYNDSWYFKNKDIESDYYFHFPEHDNCYAKLYIEPGHILINDHEFLFKTKGVSVDRKYPTSLETIKFKSEPDKCVGEKPHHVYMGDDDYMAVTSIKQDLINRKAKRQAQKVFDFGMNYGMSSQKLNEIISNDNEFSHMLKQTMMYDLMSKDIASTFEIMSKLSSQYPLTPKDCYKNLPNMIYVKKLKTFLKNG